MDDLKPLVSQIGDAIDRRATEDELYALIHKALKIISERKVGFIDTGGHDHTAINGGEAGED